MRKTPPQSLLCVLLSVILLFSPVTSYAAVQDNTGTAAVELLIGEPSTSGNTVFSLLEQVLSTVTGTQSYLVSMNDSLSTQLRSVSNKVDNVASTAGGGCYLTLYSHKNYLNGYKLKVSDGTTAKSCFIGFDEDSNYYCGVLRAPLKDNIYIQIIDARTGKDQGTMATSINTTSGYATVFLDDLVTANLQMLCNVQDSISRELCKDSVYVSNASYFPIVRSAAWSRNQYLNEFLTVLCSKTVNSSTRQSLIDSGEWFTAACGNGSLSLLLESGFVEYLKNDRDKLRAMADNPTTRSLANNSDAFKSVIQTSNLITERSDYDNWVSSGHVICIQAYAPFTYGCSIITYPGDYVCSACGTQNLYNGSGDLYYESSYLTVNGLICPASGDALRVDTVHCTYCGYFAYKYSLSNNSIEPLNCRNSITLCQYINDVTVGDNSLKYQFYARIIDLDTI